MTKAHLSCTQPDQSTSVIRTEVKKREFLRPIVKTESSKTHQRHHSFLRLWAPDR